MDCKGKQLLFEIKPGSDGNVLWKGTIRIKVMKVDPEHPDIVEKTRELNLKQFLQVKTYTLILEKYFRILKNLNLMFNSTAL